MSIFPVIFFCDFRNFTFSVPLCIYYGMELYDLMLQCTKIPYLQTGIAANYAVKKRWENFTVIRNVNDLITHLPPAFLGFSHVGEMLKIGKKGKYTPIEAHFARNILRELKGL